MNHVSAFAVALSAFICYFGYCEAFADLRGTSNKIVRKFQETSAELTIPSMKASVVETSISTPPVIGVFSHPHHNGTFYIAASYIKFLEAGGARTIVIPYDGGEELLDEIFLQIHMIFLPGGEAALSPSVKYMLSKAEISNQAGHWYPVWGTCLGFEFLVSYFGGSPLDEVFYAENVSLPLLNVVGGQGHAASESLYGSTNIYNIVTTRSVTMNNHKYGISPDRFKLNRNLTSRWKITSTNVDRDGKPFVSTIEPLDSTSHPYFGTQYHPEKNAFEYGMYANTNIPYEAIDHSPDGVIFSNYMSRYVVNLARKSQYRNRKTHRYTEPQRFPLVYTYPIQVGIAFEQIYLIPTAKAFAEAAPPPVRLQIQGEIY